MRTVESLSHHHREVTPLPLCRYLVDRVLAETGADRVAVLWVCRRTLYWHLWPAVDLWGQRRDARLYAGPWPVVCHPPCGPWGKYRSRCHQSPVHGILAMRLVHQWGGVVEQPVGSRLFREHGQGGRIEGIEQGDFGHLARKPTLLYWTVQSVGDVDDRQVDVADGRWLRSGLPGSRHRPHTGEGSNDGH